MENKTELIHHEIIIALFAGKDGAIEALHRLSKEVSVAVPDLTGQTAVITMNEKGKISSSIPKAKGKTAKGAALGAVAGLLVGLPVAGAIVGGVIGTVRGKKHAESEMDQVTMTEIADHMQPNSSVLVAEVEDWQASTISDVLYLNGAVKVIHAQKDKLADLIAADDAEI